MSNVKWPNFVRALISSLSTYAPCVWHHNNRSRMFCRRNRRWGVVPRVLMFLWHICGWFLQNKTAESYIHHSRLWHSRIYSFVSSTALGDSKVWNGLVSKTGRCNLRRNSFLMRGYYLVMISNRKCAEIWYPQIDKLTKFCHLLAKWNQISSCFTEVTEFRHHISIWLKFTFSWNSFLKCDSMSQWLP